MSLTKWKTAALLRVIQLDATSKSLLTFIEFADIYFSSGQYNRIGFSTSNFRCSSGVVLSAIRERDAEKVDSGDRDRDLAHGRLGRKIAVHFCCA